MKQMIPHLTPVCLAVTLAAGCLSPLQARSETGTPLIVSRCQTGVPIYEDECNKIADAIYRVEGGGKTRYPYGVKSIKTKNPRQVCINTIKHAWRDFHGHGTMMSREFLYFLADRYCPPSCDKVGNVRWKANITKILNIK